MVALFGGEEGQAAAAKGSVAPANGGCMHVRMHMGRRLVDLGKGLVRWGKQWCMHACRLVFMWVCLPDPSECVWSRCCRRIIYSSLHTRLPLHLGDAGAGDLLDTAGLLDRIFESVCRPLKVRVEQVLLNAPPLLLTFQLAQLIDFYVQLVGGLAGPRSHLAATLVACR